MRAVQKLARGVGQVALVDVPQPLPGSDEVLVRVKGAGVCGTDLHIFDDHYPTHPPVTLGHEVSGVVAALGPQVDPGWDGRAVVCETFFSVCGFCRFCRSGSPNLCAKRLSIGSHVDGGMADYLVIPAANLHAIPDRLGTVEACLVEPFAAVCNALCDPPLINPGDSALVIGPGPMGLLAAQLAHAARADVTVVGTESDLHRLQVAADLGFATEGVSEEMRNYTDNAGGGFDIAIDCAGPGPAMAAALQRVRAGGHVVRIGVAGDDITIPLDEIWRKELTISSGFATKPAAWRRALHLLDQGAIHLQPLVTDVLGLDDWEMAFESARAGRGIKFVLAPNPD